VKFGQANFPAMKAATTMTKKHKRTSQPSHRGHTFISLLAVVEGSVIALLLTSWMCGWIRSRGVRRSVVVDENKER
jgi:hypothetical protein